MQTISSTKIVVQNSRPALNKWIVVFALIAVASTALAIWALAFRSPGSAGPGSGVVPASSDSSGSRSVSSSQSAAVATVSTIAAGLSPVKSHVSVSGSIAARHAVDIGAEVSGLKIVEVNVDHGDFVTRGQVLARMNSDILQAQLSREKANLDGALASVQKARQPNRVEDIAGLRAAVSQAEAATSQARANLHRAQANASNLRGTAERYVELGRQGAASRLEVDNHHAAATMAEAEAGATKRQIEASEFAVTQAREKLRAAEAGGRHEDISISLASAGQIRASIRQIEAQMAQAVVRAPSNGVITKRFAELGEISSSGQPMFSMSRDNELELQGQVQEVDLPNIKAGQMVTVTPASPQLKPFSARVREIDPTVDPRTRLGMVYIDVSGNAHLKQGMYATATIESGVRQALTVPSKSVLVQDSSKVVFVLRGTQVERRVVQLGTVSGDMVEVLAGLTVGEQIITDGAGFLSDGDVVRISSSINRSAR